MGLFDYVRCDYPLPCDPQPPVDAGWQTKSMECPYMDLIVIGKDGRLWIETYDIEDRSDPDDPDDFGGCMTRINKRLEPLSDYRGEVRFYNYEGRERWEFSALFDDGKLINIKRIEVAHD